MNKSNGKRTKPDCRLRKTTKEDGTKPGKAFATGGEATSGAIPAKGGGEKNC